MRSIIILDQNTILISIGSNDFFQNSHLIRLNKTPLYSRAYIEVKLILEIKSNNSVYVN